MAIYEPIDPGIPIRASLSDLSTFRWYVQGIEAAFTIPGDASRLISVRFDGQSIVRILDEEALSTEDNGGTNVGLVPDHFAYRVRNAAFEQMQSTAWKEALGNIKHYQFVTGSTCMDVVSNADPSFQVMKRQQAG